MPLIDSMVVVEESSICAIEDSHITYHCQPGMVPSETKISICMEDGTWSPNPSDLMCTSIERNNSSHLPSSGMHNYIHVLDMHKHQNIWRARPCPSPSRVQEERRV